VSGFFPRIQVGPVLISEGERLESNTRVIFCKAVPVEGQTTGERLYYALPDTEGVVMQSLENGKYHVAIDRGVVVSVDHTYLFRKT
jgi:hypothetical protein